MEICVDNIQSVSNAYFYGAKRIELCSALSEGGLTPSVGFLRAAKSITSREFPIFVMIRPRGGNDFIYSQAELGIMAHDLKLLKENGADGFVFGILDGKNEIDEISCKRLLDLASPLPCTFHRAFDFVAKPEHSVDVLIELGFKRILTSGLQTSAFLGKELLKRLISKYKDDIIIMPGAGVNVENIREILEYTKATEIHSSARAKTTLTLDNCAGSSLNLGSINEDLKMISNGDIVAEMVKIFDEVQRNF